MLKRYILSAAATLMLALPSPAETVLLDEDFNGDYSKSFPYMYDADQLTPNSAIASLFKSNATGYYMPWWVLRDNSTSTDKFMGSHSYYQTPAKSSDWFLSVPIAIPTRGFVLSLDAQSVPVRGADHLSDLSLYITEEMVSPATLPTIPVMVWEKIPAGNDPDNCENDWTRLSFNLDDYAGKTIYLNLVNENYDNDIICIDNVKVARADPADFHLTDHEQFTAAESFSPEAVVTVTSAEGLKDWKVTFSSGETNRQWQGDFLAQGATESFTASVDLMIGVESEFSFTLEAANAETMVISGAMTRMAFIPVHRVFIEETTSLKCGNCPIAAFTMESMLDDPEIGDCVMPVSVHIGALGYDPMAVASYYTNLPNNMGAPIAWIERGAEDGFGKYDMVYDPEEPMSFAYRVKQRLAEQVPFDVELMADWIKTGTDTTGIKCTALVRPALNISDVNYRVAFVLTENNVGLDHNPLWQQENYLSGYDIAGRCGGWCDLPKQVLNARFHDVARAISAYNGHANSLPSNLEIGKNYWYEYELTLPDTYSWSDSGGILLSPAIRPQMCEVTAIVIDANTGAVVNGARMAMHPAATERFTAQDLVEAGIDDIIIDSDSEADAEYYDLTGRRVTHPGHGFYLRRIPSSSKIIKQI